MARPPRIEYPGAWYHVMNRGVNRQDVFVRPGDGLQFLALLEEALSLFDAECHAFCLMPNHYHLLLHTPGGNLSQVMRQLGARYTQRFNVSRERDGPLFRGRYKAILVDADSYLLQVSRYIHRNPVEAGLTPQPETYRWSSYRSYLTPTAGPEWLRRDMLLEMIGGPDPVDAYRSYVEAGVDEATGRFFNRARRSPLLGSREFRDWLRNGRSRRRPLPTIDAILSIVAETYGVSPETLTRNHRGRNGEARGVAMLLCRQLGGYKLAEIADAMGRCSQSSVSKAVTRAREHAAADADFAALLSRLEKRVK